MDEESATSYLYEIEHNFSYLGLTGEGTVEVLENYTNTIASKLGRQANFVVSDFSGSLDFRVDIEQIVTDNDVVIVVTEPSVSSVRSTQKLLDKLRDVAIPQLTRPRIMVVLNYHRPDGCFNLNTEEVERFIKTKPDIVIPFFKTAAKQLIEGKKLQTLEKGKVTPFSDLTLAINGQTQSKTAGLFRFLPKRGKK